MVRFLARFLLTFFAVTLAVAASPAYADKQYCTPEAYLPDRGLDEGVRRIDRRQAASVA